MNCFVDVETTGTGDQDAIIEVSVLDEHGTDRLTTLVSPLAPISDSAREVHGLAEEDLTDAPSFNEIAPRLWQLLIHEAERVWAYNATFDRSMLEQTAELAGFSFRDPTVEGTGLTAAAWRDLMDPATQYFEEDQWLALSDAADRLGIQVTEDSLHRARADAELARRLWQELSEEGLFSAALE